MLRNRSWFGNWGQSKPKDLHSLDHLKYLCNVMNRNQVVTEQNKTLLVENLRTIAEILIWGDQNDSSVFDFFLEKNMLSFFLKIMKQKCGSYVCVQLLQTLNILFENIRNETSIYYLLSNNHVNSIIVHKFDFSDEEVMAYYISFLKTLSLKLNPHSIHFFFNEYTNDFPLYTEAIKFFNHNEKMVRIAVRTLTLNVFRVEEPSMLKFVGDKTAVPYFSNLVWFIGNHVLEIDSCLRKPIKDQQMLIKLGDLVAEHLDHLHYLNDILLLRISDFNHILTDHLLNRLLIPLYIYSLISSELPNALSDRPRISPIISLFLLSQVFLILSFDSLIQQLVDIILNGKLSIFDKPEFMAPPESLEESLIQATKVANKNIPNSDSISGIDEIINEAMDESVVSIPQINEAPITDEEKVAGALNKKFNIQEERPFLQSLFDSLDCRNKIDDHSVIFALCLIYAIVHNKGVNNHQLKNWILPNANTPQSLSNDLPCKQIIGYLIDIMHLCCKFNSRIRLVTLEMSIILLKKLVMIDGKSILPDEHLASIEQANEEAALVLRDIFKKDSEGILLDMFQDEIVEIKKRKSNVEYLMMDANLLLPPNQLTPILMNGSDFTRRLPCADIERTHYSIRVFLLMRELSNTLRNIEPTPFLVNLEKLVELEEVLDLNNSDMIACTVMRKNQPKMRRFMVVDAHQFILIEPDSRRLGWGIAKYVAMLQDVEVCADKEDSRSLIINIRQNSGSGNNKQKKTMAAKFMFDDHIRCMAAKQRLTKGRIKVRQRKMMEIAKLIDFRPIGDYDMPKNSSSTASRDIPRSQSQTESLSRNHYNHHHLLCRNNAIPGSAVAENGPRNQLKLTSRRKSTSSSSSLHLQTQGKESRESSPKPFLDTEEIPLEDMSPRTSRNSMYELPDKDTQQR